MNSPDVLPWQHIVVGALLFLIAFLIWIVFSAAKSGKLPILYKRSFQESRRERLFLSSVGFFVTFFIVRIITFLNYNSLGPFHDLYIHGVHVHHLVWGIVLLLLVGYLWLWEAGSGAPGSRIWVARVMAVCYGIGSALTLDEFALWLNLKDVYWTAEGAESVRIVFLFGGLLSMGVWGGTFLHAASREAMRIFRRNGNGKVIPPESDPESEY
jgi:hypothetical protein